MTAEAPIAGIVLAAGQSTRMGRNKLLLPLGGTTVLRRAIGTAVEAGLSPIYVVLGHEGERIREGISGLPCTPVPTQASALGMNPPWRAGFRALTDEAASGIVLLGDMPFVLPAMIEEMVARFRNGSASLVGAPSQGVVAAP